MRIRRPKIKELHDLLELNDIFERELKQYFNIIKLNQEIQPDGTLQYYLEAKYDERYSPIEDCEEKAGNIVDDLSNKKFQGIYRVGRSSCMLGVESFGIYIDILRIKVSLV